MNDVLEFLQLTDFHATDLLVMLSIIVLEGLLSCDNAVALAMLVRRLPQEQQGRALRYGILGAYTFLFFAMLAATWIINQWYLKVLGGAYLLWVSISHFRHAGAQADPAAPPRNVAGRILGLNAFWSTVVTVELTDIAFSVDSIAAAVALSNKLWVLYLGSMTAILVMRFAAQGFIKLLRKFPNLETAAFCAVAVIGLKLVIEFPLDVVGRTQPFAPGVTYSTAHEYHVALEKSRAPLIDIPHIITVNRGALPEPDPKAFAKESEYRLARSDWNVKGRAFIHMNEWASSLLMLFVLASGFLKKRKT
jgi:YkoY family integral membrane protein